MENPTNGELGIMLGNIHEKVDTVIEQVLKINGRVTSLESAKNMILGGLIITNVIILPSALILLSKYVDK